MDDGARGGADDQSLRAKEALGHGVGMTIVDADYLVYHAAVEDRGRLRLLQVLHAGQTMSLLGFDGDNLDTGAPLLQAFAHPRHGAAGAEAGAEVPDLSLRLLPDLGDGGLIMGAGVVG